MTTQILLLMLGAGLLYLGAECLVRGAAGLARLLGVSPLIVGLTVVAYGTSMPELVVCAVASLEGKGELALANVVGSNIANLGLILGITGLFAPLRVDGSLGRRELPWLAATALLLPLLLVNGSIGRVQGGVLVSAAIIYTTVAARAKRGGQDFTEGEGCSARAPIEAQAARKMPMALLSIAGLLLLVLGGRYLVDSATYVALAFGMSVRVVGLTVVAIGTSPPELATALVAGLKGHTAIAIGNVVGSNIFNVLLVLGGASMVRPITVPLQGMAVDLVVLWVLTAVATVMLRRARVTTRVEAVLLVSLYGTFLALLVVGHSR
jgi:cation:H+ antiporter